MADNDNITFDTGVEDINEPLIPGVTFPSKESLDTLQAAFNDALLAYAAANDKVPTPTVLMVAVQTMIGFPYSWLTKYGNEDKFAAYMDSEVKHFLALVEFQKKASEIVS